MLVHAISLFATLAAVTAAPSAWLANRDTAPVSSADLKGFAPFTQFARAAYCPTETIQDWSCGEACKAVPDFKPTLVGGDGGTVPFFFVGYWSAQNTVVVAHQGTDPVKFSSVLNDLDFIRTSLDTGLFPGVSSDVGVHQGFHKAHAKTAPQILAEVKKLMDTHKTQNVACVGHSLGGALAELDSVFLTLNLPSSTKIRVVTYGKPRVGDKDWVNLVNSKVRNFQRINNEDDTIPILPPRKFGFRHPNGEIRIVSRGEAVSCPDGDEATDEQCTVEAVPNVLQSNIINHLGPYEGTFIGTIFCF